MANRIRKQLLSASKKVNKKLREYNKVPPYGPNAPPHKLDRADVVSLTSEVWQHLGTVLTSNSSVPHAIRRRLVENLMLKKRATEEQSYIINDIQCVMSHLENCHELLDKFLHSDDLKNFNIRANKGKVAMVAQRMDSIKQQIRQLEAMLSESSSVKAATDIQQLISNMEGIMSSEDGANQANIAPDVLASIMDEINQFEESEDEESDDES